MQNTYCYGGEIGGGEGVPVSYRPVIQPQAFSDPVPLAHDFHRDFSAFLYHLGETGRIGGGGVPCYRSPALQARQAQGGYALSHALTRPR